MYYNIIDANISVITIIITDVSISTIITITKHLITITITTGYYFCDYYDSIVISIIIMIIIPIIVKSVQAMLCYLWYSSYTYNYSFTCCMLLRCY